MGGRVGARQTYKEKMVSTFVQPFQWASLVCIYGADNFEGGVRNSRDM